MVYLCSYIIPFIKFNGFFITNPNEFLRLINECELKRRKPTWRAMSKRVLLIYAVS